MDAFSKTTCNNRHNQAPELQSGGFEATGHDYTLRICCRPGGRSFMTCPLPIRPRPGLFSAVHGPAFFSFDSPLKVWKLQHEIICRGSEAIGFNWMPSTEPQPPRTMQKTHSLMHGTRDWRTVIPFLQAALISLFRTLQHRKEVALPSESEFQMLSRNGGP